MAEDRRLVKLIPENKTMADADDAIKLTRGHELRRSVDPSSMKAGSALVAATRRQKAALRSSSVRSDRALLARLRAMMASKHSTRSFAVAPVRDGQTFAMLSG